MMIEYQTANLNQVGEAFLPAIKSIVDSFNFNQIIDFQNDYSMSLTVLIHTDQTVFDYFKEVSQRSLEKKKI